MYAVKENKRYNIGDDNALRELYKKKGFDIADESGKIVEVSPVKSVPYAKYMEVKSERDALAEECNVLKVQLSELAAVQGDMQECAEDTGSKKPAKK